MILADIFEGAILIVVAAARADPEIFGGGDLEVVDIFWIHEWLKDAIAKPEREDILQGLFPQIMVEPEDLILAQVGGEERVECLGRALVSPDRLFDHESYPPTIFFKELMFIELGEYLLVQRGEGSEVVHAIPGKISKICL